MIELNYNDISIWTFFVVSTYIVVFCTSSAEFFSLTDKSQENVFSQTLLDKRLPTNDWS